MKLYKPMIKPDIPHYSIDCEAGTIVVLCFAR